MIPVCQPWLPGNEENYVSDAIRTNWISSAGTYINRFEDEFSTYCDTSYGVSCTNGGSALHLAYLALGLKKGDEVILPSFTMSAPVNAAIMTGATPVFVDADPHTYCMYTPEIEDKITPHTKAITAVHLFGQMCDMEEINLLAKKYDISVIEDAAEAHGAEYRGMKAGSLSDIAAFSFYGNKILTTGEGGMAVTNNLEYAEHMRKLRNYAFEIPRFLHTEIGYNYRLSNLSAAIGVAQTENADKLVNARKNVGERYDDLLERTSDLILPTKRDNMKNVYWMYGVMLGAGVKKTKEEVMNSLKERGVDTRSFFIPMHKQPVFLDGTLPNAPRIEGSFPISEWLSERGFYIPSSSNLSDRDAQYVAKSLKEVIAE
jgi:perosamine synthetase